jgi:hypothetical protein
MQPIIQKNDNYIEIIGHYDDPILCAKMTLLADLYAVEHREGYAKFKLEDNDKLDFISDKLEFVNPCPVNIYINGNSFTGYDEAP